MKTQKEIEDRLKTLEELLSYMAWGHGDTRKTHEKIEILRWVLE